MVVEDCFIFGDGQTRRSCAAADTLSRLEPILACFGITRVANITGLDRIGIPVAVAIRPASRSLVVSHGKGTTLEDAKVSAIMESIELHHAERPAISTRIASARDLCAARDAVLDCARMPRTANQPFDETAAIGWTSGHDLVRGATCWVPYAYVAVDDALSSFPVPPGIPVNSNGLASGNTREEAIIHALCELVERDAIALWHVTPDDERRARAVDMATVDDPHCRDLLARYDAAGIDVYGFELTTDIGMPVFEVFIRERGSGVRDGFSATGSGCDLWRAMALSRALKEAAQCRLTHVAGAREDLVDADYAAHSDRMRQVQRFLALADRPRRAFRPATESEPDLAEGLEMTLSHIVEALRRIGIDQIVAVDLAPGNVDFQVVRLLVPGLEGLVFEAGYVPGARSHDRIAAAGSRA